MHSQLIRSVLIAALFASSAAAQTFHGPTPYLSSADSPFALGSGAFALEDFEDGLLNTPGVSAPTGIVTSTQYSGAIIDSVDADDGVIDNACLNGDSFFGGGSTTIRFVFSASALGTLPNKAGLVWTDGGPSATVVFEAFDGNGVSLGTVVAAGQGDSTYYGTTGEDRFYGVDFAGGIGELRISHNAGGIEVDHLQYEVVCTGLAATTYCTAKTNSLGCVPEIGINGCPSTSSASLCSIFCTDVIPAKAGLLFYGFAPAAIPFQGGFLCVQPPTTRTAIQTSGGTPVSSCNGEFSFDINAHIQSGLDANLVPGAMLHAQYWYRDPASPSTTGLSDALSVQVGP